MEIVRRPDGRWVYANASEEESVAISNLIRDEVLPAGFPEPHEEQLAEPSLVDPETEVFLGDQADNVVDEPGVLRARRLQVCEALLCCADDSLFAHSGWQNRYNRFEVKVKGRGTYHVEFASGSTRVLSRGWHDELESIVEGDWS